MLLPRKIDDKRCEVYYYKSQIIGVWCSGSTIALGAFSLGSIPSTPTGF